MQRVCRPGSIDHEILQFVYTTLSCELLAIGVLWLGYRYSRIDDGLQSKTALQLLMSSR